MKWLNTLLIAFLVISTLACSEKKDQSAEVTVSDSLPVENTVPVQAERVIFSGEYLIGDGNVYIVQVGDTIELRNSMNEPTDFFYFQGTENDTLRLYSNQDKSITFKMNPDHKEGKYYAPGEEWPVSYVGPSPTEETNDTVK